jgi:predicted nucleic acid-binding protein
MPSWVVDCSLAAALGLPDEGSAKADSLIVSLDADTALWVPPLWWYEIANVLVMAQRRERISEAIAAAIMSLYESLPLRVDNMAMNRIADSIRELAQRHRLTAYDAAYLELAQRRNLGLATLDEQLEEAARASGLSVFHGP